MGLYGCFNFRISCSFVSFFKCGGAGDTNKSLNTLIETQILKTTLKHRYQKNFDKIQSIDIFCATSANKSKFRWRQQRLPVLRENTNQRSARHNGRGQKSTPKSPPAPQFISTRQFSPPPPNPIQIHLSKFPRPILPTQIHSKQLLPIPPSQISS